MSEAPRAVDPPGAPRPEVLIVNGRERPLPHPASVRGALADLGLDDKPVAVEVNGRLVRRARHAETEVRAGDRLEIVTFVGGG